MWKRCCILAVVACIGALPAEGFTNSRNVGSEPVGMAHVAWGLPLDGGAVGLLLVAPRFTLRDGEELARRIELRLDTEPLWDARHLGYDPAVPERHLPGFAHEDRAARLAEAMRARHDVVVLAGFDFGALPSEAAAALARRVADGAGLVLVEFGAPPGGYPEWLDTLLAEAQAGEGAVAGGLMRGVPPMELEAGGSLARERLLALWHSGEGRIALLRYEAAAPRTHCLVPQLPTGLSGGTLRLDNALSLVARVVRWAAGREPRDRIAALVDAAPRGPDEEQIPPFLEPEYVALLQDSMTPQALRPYWLELAEPAGSNYSVAVQVRNPGAEIQFPPEEEDRTLPRGSAGIPLDLRVGPGNYLVDVWLRDRGRVVDWFTAQVAVQGWPDLVSVTPDRAYLEPPGVLGLAVETRATHATFSIPREATVYARALDPAGRVLAEQHAVVGSEAERVALRLGFDVLDVPLVKVETYVADGRHEAFPEWALHRIRRQDHYFPVLGNGETSAFFLGAMVPALDEFNARHYLQALRDAGFGSVHAPAGRSAMFQAALLGLRLLPEVARFDAPTVAEGVVRQPCLTHAAYLDRTMTALREQSLVHLAGGQGAYSLGHGNVLCDTEENVCQSPSCLAGFQAALRARHGTVAALNAAWGSDFADFGQAVPLGRGHAPSWVAFRSYMDGVFSRFHGEARAAVRGVDPKARVGFAARGRPHAEQGYDWHGLAEALDFVAVPLEVPALADKARSYQPRPGAWAGVLGPEFEAGSWQVWHAALQRLGGVWCAVPFGSAEDAAPGALLTPEGALTPAATALAAAGRELGAGLGALLLAAERGPSSVAVYESRRSRYLNAADPADGVDSLAAEAAFLRLLKELGYQGDFIAEDMLSSATLAGRRVLVLPAVRALDDAEVAAVQAFAEGGGMVLADLLPGTHDGHGLPRSESPLGGLFGVARERGGEPGLAARHLADGRAVFADPAVRVADGTAWAELAEVPLGISASVDAIGAVDGHPDQENAEGAVGNGRHLLLNHLLADGDVLSQPAADWVRAHLAGQGVPPEIALEGRNAERFRGERMRLRYGAAEILALLCAPESGSGSLEFEVPPGGAAYDLRTGAQVSSRRGLLRRGGVGGRLDFAPGEAALAAVLPYEVQEIIAAPLDPLRADTPVAVFIDIETRGDTAPGDHLVALQLLDLQKEPMMPPVLVECPGGTGQSAIVPRFDQRKRPYWLRARDLLSGTESEVQVQLAPGE